MIFSTARDSGLTFRTRTIRVPPTSHELVILDGSEGEGGGQILRSALSLSLITGRPFEIANIRARRKQPGLRPQHLACVRGIEAISGARSQGAELGSSRLRVDPGPARSGSYLLEVGTAGSAALLFQCLFYPFALAGGGELTLRGGTHVDHSPSYHYLALIWLPMAKLFGLQAELSLAQAGFYPKGAGEFVARVPARTAPLDAIDLRTRGTLREVQASSFVGGLPFEIAERQSRAATQALRERGIYCTARNAPLPAGPSQGSALIIRAQFERTVAGFSALGERGKPAEDVAREAVAQFAGFMESSGALDEHMGDQILLPAALHAAGYLGPRGETWFSTSQVTAHLQTNAAVLKRFLPVEIDVSIAGDVHVRPSNESA